ncbi:hypothetical protein ABSA28_01049 [Candidatus Hepatincolaceae symbiont of Richtersius coronifer]
MSPPKDIILISSNLNYRNLIYSILQIDNHPARILEYEFNKFMHIFTDYNDKVMIMDYHTYLDISIFINNLLQNDNQIICITPTKLSAHSSKDIFFVETPINTKEFLKLIKERIYQPPAVVNEFPDPKAHHLNIKS